MCSRLVSLSVALAISNSFKSEVRLMIVRRYPVVNYVREMISSRLAAPVISLPPGADPELPFYLAPLYIRHPSLPAGGSIWLDLICQAIINVLCFSLAFMVWGGSCYLITSIWLERDSIRSTRLDRWCGFMIGAAGSVIIVALGAGIVVPLLILAGLPFESLCLEQSTLFQLVWLVVDRLGIWWN